jgi:hypothetical protein
VPLARLRLAFHLSTEAKHVQLHVNLRAHAIGASVISLS